MSCNIIVITFNLHAYNRLINIKCLSVDQSECMYTVDNKLAKFHVMFNITIIICLVIYWNCYFGATIKIVVTVNNYNWACDVLCGDLRVWCAVNFCFYFITRPAFSSAVFVLKYRNMFFEQFCLVHQVQCLSFTLWLIWYDMCFLMCGILSHALQSTFAIFGRFIYSWNSIPKLDGTMSFFILITNGWHCF